MSAASLPLVPAQRDGEPTPVLQARGLSKQFRLGSQFRLRNLGFSRTPQVVQAVDGVDLQLHAGRTLGLVGESGCGKSTLASMIMGLQRPTAGLVLFEGRQLSALSRKQLRQTRRSIQMVWQDPYTSLNPRLSVEQIVGEPLAIHRQVLPRRERPARVRELLEQVGLGAGYAQRYPRELSGGQRQRVGIARALALHPQVVICDEPVSALDVSVRAQVLNVLHDLQAELGLAYLMISHDLSVVRHVSDDVAVMYLGQIVEQGTREQVYGQPAHPYTQALLAAAPVPDPARRELAPSVHVVGEPPSPVDPPSGCHFRTRCPFAQPVCAQQRPPLVAHPGVDHRSACHFASEVAASAPT